MKKLVLTALSVLLLAGCGGGASEERVSKTCTMSVSGIDTQVVLNGKGSELTDFEMIGTYPGDMFGIEISELKDDEKEQLEQIVTESVAKSLNVEKADLKLEFNDDAIVVRMQVDVDKASDDIKEAFGLNNTTNFDAAVKDLETNGNATCK